MKQIHLITRIKILRTYTLSAVLFLVFLPTFSFALTPIAHTDVVPYQRIEYGTTFNFGVVAFSKAGIDRVDFVISGQGYSGGTKSSSAMALNTRVASTSPGAEYPGVYEYYVGISSSEFTSNGTITVTPTVYGNDAGTRALPSVTLYVEGASDETPVEAWISTTGNDTTGTVNNRSLPYATLAGAVTDIEAANSGICDGAIVYLEEGTYTISSGTTTTVNDRLTITRASGAAIENTVITEGGSSWNTNHLKVSGVTLTSSGGGDRCLTTPGAWIDHCRLLGPGRTIANGNPVSCSSSYWTGNYVYDTDYGIGSPAPLARGLKVEKLANDLHVNNNFLVNTTVDDIHPSGTGWHADVEQQYWGTPDNVIIYNLVATDINYQGIFWRNVGPSGNCAIVNTLIEMHDYLATGGSGSFIYGEWNHLILWHNTFGIYESESLSSWGHFTLNTEPETGVGKFTNCSFIGNMFHIFRFSGTVNSGSFNNGNSYGNEAVYNHFEITSGYSIIDSDAGGTYSSGEDVIDFDIPGSDTFGYPRAGSVIINRLPTNLTGVLGDALGNPRDGNPDVGALEGDSGTAPPSTPDPECGDSICEGSETYETCPSDCPPPTDPVCGDGICEGSETYETCPSDCPPPSPPAEGIVPSGVTASSDDGNVPSNIIDDNLATRWSAEGDGQWIEIDLGNEYDLTHLLIAFYRGDLRTASFEIHISTNGISWDTVFNGNSILSAQQEQYDVSGKARYVKIIGHGNTENAWNSITEVDVFGSASEASPPSPPEGLSITIN